MSGHAPHLEEKAMAKKLYVGNLSYSTTDATLSELFGAVGEVLSVNLITDRMSGRSKGFAFVEMADDTAALTAINQLNGQEVEGRALKVAEARPKREDRGDRGGGSERRRRW
jgi:cold-inducible RNA-binding protein